ncbi:MAG: hypothetical protein HYV63_11965 [Candidatus Schekmanbacteria bacterium]|nr:hypothetical protein [Candidatus Schekmanbacteria bacterium]
MAGQTTMAQTSESRCDLAAGSQPDVRGQSVCARSEKQDGAFTRQRAGTAPGGPLSVRPGTPRARRVALVTIAIIRLLSAVVAAGRVVAGVANRGAERSVGNPSLRCFPVRGLCIAAMLALLFGFLVPAGVAAGPSCDVLLDATDPPRSIGGTWRFHQGDDRRWALASFDDSAWETRRVPGTWRQTGRFHPTGMSWYRVTVCVGSAAASSIGELDGVGVLMGKVYSAYELFANGRKLGEVGSLPPRARPEYDRAAVFALPADLARSGRVVLALRVWRSEAQAPGNGGPYVGPIHLGRLDELGRELVWREFPALLSAVVCVLVGLLHLHVSRGRRNQDEYFAFSLFAIDAGLYLLLRSQIKYEFSSDFFLMKELEYTAVFLMPIAGTHFLWPFLGLRIGWGMRAYCWSALLALGAVVLEPGLVWNMAILPYWEVATAAYLLVLVVTVTRQSLALHREARTLGVGCLLLGATALVDIVADRGLIMMPRTVHYGLAAVVLSMAGSLSGRFRRIQAELDAFRLELAHRVEQRTAELSDANQRLRATQRELECLNRALEERVRERTAELVSAQALLIRNQKLSALGRMAAGVLHDVRGGISVTRGYLELLVNEEDSSQRGRLADIAREASQRTLGWLSDVLAVARDRIHVAPVSTSMHVLVGRVRRLLEAMTFYTDVELQLEAETDHPEVVVDVSALERLLTNLAANAMDAMSGGGCLVVAIRRVPDCLVLTCRDSGPGVPQEIRDALFNEFVTHGKRNGTGLGLVMVKQIAEAHGGTVAYEDGEGGGACFRVEIPQR